MFTAFKPRVFISVFLLFSYKVMASSQVEILKDREGLVYLGCSVNAEKILPYLKHLNRVVGSEKYLRLREHQARRDLQSFHITLVNPFELKEIDQEKALDATPCEFQWLGLGRVRKAPAESYFVVLESSLAQGYRASLGLKRKDFHVTVGFEPSDIYGVNKGRSTLLPEPAKPKN